MRKAVNEMEVMDTVYHNGVFITFTQEQVIAGLSKMTDKEVNAYHNILKMEMGCIQSEDGHKRTLRHFGYIEDIKEARNI